MRHFVGARSENRGKALTSACEKHDLNGVVAKRKSDPYRRGVHWWKIKNPAYSQAEGRHKLLSVNPRPS
jgi:ATP-dependent DNA ligase